VLFDGLSQQVDNSYLDVTQNRSMPVGRPTSQKLRKAPLERLPESRTLFTPIEPCCRVGGNTSEIVGKRTNRGISGHIREP
jgi:hypothetical protein